MDLEQALRGFYGAPPPPPPPAAGVAKRREVPGAAVAAAESPSRGVAPSADVVPEWEGREAVAASSSSAAVALASAAPHYVSTESPRMPGTAGFRAGMQAMPPAFDGGGAAMYGFQATHGLAELLDPVQPTENVSDSIQDAYVRAAAQVRAQEIKAAAATATAVEATTSSAAHGTGQSAAAGNKGSKDGGKKKKGAGRARAAEARAAEPAAPWEADPVGVPTLGAQGRAPPPIPTSLPSLRQRAPAVAHTAGFQQTVAARSPPPQAFPAAEDDSDGLESLDDEDEDAGVGDSDGDDESEGFTRSGAVPPTFGDAESRAMPAMTLDEVMDDLVIRFVANVPSEELLEFERICFLVEQAHWCYIDFYREDHPDLPGLGAKAFMKALFKRTPLLAPYLKDVEELYSRFTAYKQSVPTYGVIILNPALTKCLMVQGWGQKSWGFPKGKVNVGEEPIDCAAREAEEEVGVNVRNRLRETSKIDVYMRGRLNSLYIAPGVPEDTVFETQTRKEIQKIDWHPVSSLPENNVKNNNFYMVEPYVKRLKNWIKNTRREERSEADRAAEQEERERDKAKMAREQAEAREEVQRLMLIRRLQALEAQGRHEEAAKVRVQLEASSSGKEGAQQEDVDQSKRRQMEAMHAAHAHHVATAKGDKAPKQRAMPKQRDQPAARERDGVREKQSVRALPDQREARGLHEQREREKLEHDRELADALRARRELAAMQAQMQQQQQQLAEQQAKIAAHEAAAQRMMQQLVLERQTGNVAQAPPTGLDQFAQGYPGGAPTQPGAGYLQGPSQSQMMPQMPPRMAPYLQGQQMAPQMQGQAPPQVLQMSPEQHQMLMQMQMQQQMQQHQHPHQQHPHQQHQQQHLQHQQQQHAMMQDPMQRHHMQQYQMRQNELQPQQEQQMQHRQVPMHHYPQYGHQTEMMPPGHGPDLHGVAPNSGTPGTQLHGAIPPYAGQPPMYMSPQKSAGMQQPRAGTQGGFFDGFNN